MKYRRDSEAFGAYIGDLRAKREFSLEQVCAGLCTAQQLSRLESGEKAASKLLQDAILERLGVGAEDYEHYLNYTAYDHWEMRQRILYRITRGEMEKAKALLEEYSGLYGGTSDRVGDRLERQFILSMRAQLLAMEGADEKETGKILQEAVHLTVPDVWEKPLGKRVLSLKELNLILEAERYRKCTARDAHYKDILDYMEEYGADVIGMAKIFPKAVYFLCRYGTEDGSGVTEERLRYCNRAVEILRDSSRMYYLWEILDMREQYLKQMTARMKKGDKRMEAEEYVRLQLENTEWKKVLESVYAEYHVPKETFSYCYLYVEKGVSCISDVIRIRRRMLGMGADDLCKGICDVKTLRRLENRKSNSQRTVVGALFERLGISRDLSRTELVTDSPEVRQMVASLRKYNNNREPEKTEALLSQVKNLVSAEIRCNRQALMRQEVNILRKKQEIDDKAYCRQMREVLELTLPFEAFEQRGEKYLTREEQTCIQNMMQKMDKESQEFQDCLERFEEMYRPVAEGELLGTLSGVYGLVMGYVGSELGNRGEYERADWYNEILLREELYSRRLTSIENCLYDRWWNYTQKKRKGIPVKKEFNGEEELKRCILLSELSRQTYYGTFYRKKLEKIRKP